MGFTREDKELRKFETDPSDAAKVVVKTKVENQSSDPVPVEIVNADGAVDIQVEIPGTITLDDSTPIDVDIKNTSIDTNATIQGTPAVTISGTVPVDIQDASVAVTSASTLDVNVTNAYQNTYSMVYDGSTWRSQASDANGKAITRSQKYYTTADITALSSSTDVPLWLSAFADGVLVKNYNFNHTSANQPIVAYYTFPTLGDSNKCLKIINTYTGSNLTSVVASVVDWTFDDDLAPAATLANGGISSPANDAAAGTDVCTITPGGGGGGATYTIVVSSTDSDKYRLANTTQGTTGTTITAVPGDSIVLETSVLFDFDATGYTHSVIVTSTEDVGSTSANVTIGTTQAASATYSNDKYWEIPADDDTVEWGQAGSTSEGLFGDAYTVGIPGSLDPYTTSFWVKFTGSPASAYTWVLWFTNDATGSQNYMGCSAAAFAQGTDYQRMQWQMTFYVAGGMNMNFNTGAIYHDIDTWYHIVYRKHATVAGATVTTADADFWINGVKQTTIASATPTWTEYDTDSVAGAYTSVLSHHWGSTSGGAGWGYDEWANWDRALTDSEIATVYNSGNSGDLSSISGLRGWWRFGDGDSVGDGSGTADHSTKIHDMSGGSGAVDLNLQNYSGSATNMIKDH